MLTVLIVERDGAQAACISEMVNWCVYGFEVTGTCGDGALATEAVLSQPPDLVLTGDDLPDMTGIELIDRLKKRGVTSDFAIISEKESFETARNAMRLGVEEYLLKPVARDELIRVLKKYAERRIGIAGRDVNEYFLQTRRLLRNSFMDSFTKLDAEEFYSLEQVNDKYHFDFRQGVFQSAFVSVKGLRADENSAFLETLICDARARFDPLCYEMIPYIQGIYRVSFTFNYGVDSGVDDRLPELFDIVRERLEKCGCDDAVFCVGIGRPENDMSRLRLTLDTAERAVRCGILRGHNRLYCYEKLQFDKLTSADILTPSMLEDMKKSAEALDVKAFENAVRAAYSPISSSTDPKVLMDICWQAIETVSEALKTQDDAGSLAERRVLLEILGSETTLTGTVTVLVSWAQGLFSLRLKESEYSLPVREAVRYIAANCTQPLTLEKVAEQVHLNSSYFCTMFKKETGQNFSDYLVNCRIKEAKRLLRESNMRISQICTAVGYTDSKHFSQVFAKNVGIKPSAYRVLHG